MAKKSEKFTCEGCGKKLSKSGYYKHRKKCEAYLSKDEPVEIVEINYSEPVQFSTATHESPEPLESTEEDLSGNNENIHIEEEPQESERPDWFDFDVDVDEGATEHFPSSLKMAAGAGGMGDIGRNPSKAQIQAMHDTNLNLLILSLGGIDGLLQTYGRAVTLDKELIVKHSTDDKMMVAHAQYNWLLEKGINPSNFVSTGAIAAALSTYYVVPPVLKIRKRSKVGFFKSAGRISGFFSRIPLIGRFFKRKPSVPDSVMREQVSG